MDTHDDKLSKIIDAWVEAELTASPEWEPEKYDSIRQRLEGSPPVIAPEE